MIKIFKQLGRHWAACIAVVALLFVQAYCDLSLPDYTSKIVDIGIQQGGIESPVPETVRDTTLQALELLMSSLTMPPLPCRNWKTRLPRLTLCCTWQPPKTPPQPPARPMQ